MKVTIHPRLDPTTDIDITQCLIAAVAHELWKRYGGNEQLNWLESERHVLQLVGTPSTEPMDRQHGHWFEASAFEQSEFFAKEPVGQMCN